MNKHFALGLAAISAIVLTGCSVPAQPAATAPAGDNRPTTSAPGETSPGEGMSSEPTAQDSGALAFGATYAYEDGLSVTIGTPKPYKPKEFAAGTEGFKQFIIMDVTVVNKTGSSWDPAMFHATLQSSNKEASEIFDSPTLAGPPSTTLLNGRETTFKLGFGVADPADLVLEVRPSFDRDPVIYLLES